MPCFSFSAPTVTLEEERTEREELGESYRQIENEMHGTAEYDTTNNTHYFYDDIQAELDKIPDGDKRHLMQAMDYDPELVKTESNRILFDAESKSSKEVASRLAAYWKMRLQLFEESKAFLPIGEDEHQQSSFVKILPGDRANRPILLFDRIEVARSKIPRKTAMQQLFIALHSLSNDEQARQNGFVFIENIRGYDLYSDFDRILTKIQMSLLRDFFPAKLMCYHLCGGIGEKWVVDLVVPVIKQIAKKSIRLRIVCHTTSPQEIATELDHVYMIAPSSLPLVIGGTQETGLVFDEPNRNNNFLTSSIVSGNVETKSNWSSPSNISIIEKNHALLNGIECRHDNTSSPRMESVQTS